MLLICDFAMSKLKKIEIDEIGTGVTAELLWGKA